MNLIKEYDNIFLIVLYNKQPLDCNTVSALLKNSTVHNSKVIIWNNGPEELNIKNCQEIFEFHGYEFDFFETIENLSLAYIYNQIIALYKSLRYIFLDHDSSLSTEYLNDIHLILPDKIGMPEIFFNGRLVNPCIDMLPCIESSTRVSHTPVMTIGSGLVLGRYIIEQLMSINGEIFDERFYLYGVDTTLCLRIFNAGFSSAIIFIHGFEHSLSRLEIEDFPIKKFRRIERSCDLALRIRYYTPLTQWYKEVTRVYLSALKKMILRRDQQYDLMIFSKVLIQGKHLRDIDIS